jgi:hypothetical protein
MADTKFWLYGLVASPRPKTKAVPYPEERSRPHLVLW